MDKHDFLCKIAAMKATLGLGAYVVLVLLVLSGGHALGIDVSAPAVLSTLPANGALGVADNLGTIIVTFTEPMKGNVSYNYSPRLGPLFTQWSNDSKQLLINRTDPITPLADGTIIQINLNPYGSTSFFEDIAGNHLPAYSFSFTIGQSNLLAPSVVLSIPANGGFDLSPTLPGFSVTFDRPMETGTCINFSTHGEEWGATTKSWSLDGRTLTFTRNDPETELRSGAIFTVP